MCRKGTSNRNILNELRTCRYTLCAYNCVCTTLLLCLYLLKIVLCIAPKALENSVDIWMTAPDLVKEIKRTGIRELR